MGVILCQRSKIKKIRGWDNLIVQRNINKDKTNAQWYEATKLLKTRWVSGNRQYLVQWKDNSPSSWQYENDVSQVVK
jgi:hypothetical protein